MVDVIPSLLEKDFAEIERKFSLIKSLVNWVQIDIADGKLVPNTIVHDPTRFSTFEHPPRLELHMMVEDPVSYLDAFAKAGFKRFFAHVEGKGIEEFIERASRMDVQVGLAVDGPTSVDRIREYLDNIDAVLIMGVNAGYSGQKFREDTVEKVKAIRAIDFEIPIEVDGGMNAETARRVVRAGANWPNANSYLFSDDNVESRVKLLRSLAIEYGKDL